jgi:DTW domain-containing protein
VELCVCSNIKPTRTKHHVLILQHPQEPDKDLGSARIAHLALPNSTLRIGLSWPNLKKALGREVQPSRWGVLYLGSGSQEKTPSQEVLRWIDKRGPPSFSLEGIVVLDGTWSQAKALWWRNPWLLKLRRGVLASPQRSLYKELRREPRRECLSTIESIGLALTALGEPSEVTEKLNSLFQDLLNRYRAWSHTL